MLSKKIKITLLSLFGIAVILVVLALVTTPSQPASPAGQNNEQEAVAPNQETTAPNSGAITEPPPSPTVQTDEKQFMIISIGTNDTYRVRDLADNKEIDLFILSDAQITAGQRSDIKPETIVTVTKYLVFANGLMATELSVAAAQ